MEELTMIPEIDVLIVGAGPLPKADTTLTCSYCLRTSKLAYFLASKGFKIFIIGLDIFSNPNECISEKHSSLIGDYLLVPENEVGIKIIKDAIEEKKPKSILAVSAPAAACVCRAETSLPIWADMPGWIMAEAQLKASLSGNDNVLDRFLNMEKEVIKRADKISVVSTNQLNATMGELAYSGRLNRRNIGYKILHKIPSLAFNWESLLPQDNFEPIDLGIPNDGKVILWSGSYNLWTDVELIFSAIDNLMSRLPELHFVSTGGLIKHHNDEIYEKIKELIKTSQYENRYHMLPWLPFSEAIKWFKKSDLGLCIDGENIEINFGSRTRLVDMLSHGLCTASTTGTELAENLYSKNAIIGLDPNQKDNWGDVLYNVLSDPKILANTRKKAKEFICSEYGLEQTSHKLMEWLHKPSNAPDNMFRNCVEQNSCHTLQDKKNHQIDHLVTWQPQKEIENTAGNILDPYTPSKKSFLIQQCLKKLLEKSTTRTPVLFAWESAQNLFSQEKKIRWQSRIDRWLENTINNGFETGRRIYGSALENPTNNINKKAINIFLAKHEYNRNEGLLCKPQRIEIESSSLCNINCKICKRTYLKTPGTNLQKEMFDKLIPWLKYVVTLEIIGEGEPTLNSNLSYFIEKGAKNGCYIRIFTNGTNLTPELSTKIVSMGVNEIVVSLPGGNPKTYNEITGSNLFDKVINNLRDIRDIKQILSSSLPCVKINFPMICSTYKSAPYIVRMASSLGINNIALGPAYIPIPEMEKESLLHADQNNLKIILDKCRKTGSEQKTELFIHNKNQEINSTVMENNYGCLYPWQSILVRASGLVEACSYNRKIVGNLNSESIEDIWNGEKFQQFREGKVTQNGINYCDRCFHRAYKSKTINTNTHINYEQSWEGY